jgi:hypothetical protein
VWLQLFGVGHIKCSEFSSISEILAVAIIRINHSGKSFGSSYIGIAFDNVLEVKLLD